MLTQVDQSEDYACCEEDTEDEACDTLCLYGSDGDVAGSCIDEGAIREEQGRGVRLEDKPAVGVVGKRLVGVQGIIPMLQRGQIKMKGTDNGVRGVLSGREW